MAAGAIIAGAGLALGAYGSIRGRSVATRAANRERVLSRIQAQQVRASGQAAAFEEQRQAELAHSRALALAAASGGSASDVTATKILSGIDAEGRYRAEVRLYESEGEARMIEEAGRARASAFKDQARAYDVQTISGAVTLAGSMYSRYGGGGPDQYGGGGSGSGVDTGNSYLDTYGGPL